MAKEIKTEMKKFILKRLILNFVILFFFFVLFLFTYGLAMASYMVWFLVFISMTIIYVEAKTELYHRKTNQAISNIEYILRDIKRK